jgi:hypothetical protein
MSTNLTVVGAAPKLPAALGPDLMAAADLAKAEKAVSTRKAYGTDFRLFRSWCELKGVSPLPASPETVAAFLAAQTGDGTKPSTLATRCRYPLRPQACAARHTDCLRSRQGNATGHPAHRGRSQSTKGSGCSRQGAGNGCAGSSGP